MTAPDDKEQQLAPTRMSFGAHLDELRRRLMRAAWITAIGVTLSFIYCREIMFIIVKPYRDAMTDIGQSPALMVTGPAAGFFAYLKVSMICGLIVMAPFWIWQLWGFVASGLYNKEKSNVYRYAPLCLVLFLAGVLFGYYVLIPIGLRYLLAFPDPDLIQNLISLSEYLSLFTLFTLVLGLTFQLPTVMVALARLGIVRIQTFREKRRWVILVIFIVAAILTPPDPVTQSLLAIPLCLLYELGIFIAWAGMGAQRPPINRVALRRGLIKLALVIAIVYLMWGHVVDFWENIQADDRRPAAEAGFHDARRIVAAALEVDVAVILRTSASDEPLLYAALSAKGPALIALRQDRRALQVIDRSADESVISWTPSGATVWVAEQRREVAWDSILPGLWHAVRNGSEETAADARLLLERFAGLLPLEDESLGAFSARVLASRGPVWKA
ncbi:MAG: twin-arginine translocase subunit TatC [Planctomycetes bacterium]|nr:twin-arginine translocase subunit TatC [Planctomycetota bacterium]